ncbi:MAG: M6 family metalloprotease domain-containing protein [Paludibacteraceae bacterium]|nr:M6 family metalloprotease domain-containing protein [Paludibacteraceae bacterium]
MKKFLLFSLLFFISCSVFANIATPFPIEVEQPDGTTLTIRLHGNEHFSYKTTLDNHFVARNDKGEYVYTKYNTDGSQNLTSVVAHNADFRGTAEQNFVATLSTELPFDQIAVTQRRAPQQKQLSRGFPLLGSPRSLVILVNYSDVKFITENARQEFDDLCNLSGYSKNNNRGSCRDFFIAQSDSLFQPDFDVVGPYDLPRERAYYGADDGDNHSTNSDQMIIGACDLADAAGVDFSKYDYDGDGVIDNVFVFFAGHDQAQSDITDAIWSHRSNISQNVEFDGKKLSGYACSSELRGGSGSTGMATIGTFCHEFGHVLGLPDYYDTSYKSGETIGTWDIMCNGSYNGPERYSGATPPSYCSHSRWWLGWRKVEQLTMPGSYSLLPVALEGTTSYMIAQNRHSLDPTAKAEYFLLENRQRVGWDNTTTSVPGTGLLVWHVIYDDGIWLANRPNTSPNLLFYVESATGNKRTAGSANDTYGAQKNVFIPMLVDGTNINQPIYNIAQTGVNMTFTYKEEEFNVVPQQLNTFVTDIWYENKKINSSKTDYAIQSITLKADSLSLEDSVITITSNKEQFRFSADSSINSVSRSYSIKLTEAKLNHKFYVVFAPTKPYCEDKAIDAVLTFRHGSNMQVLAVTGYAPQKSLMSVPAALNPTYVTPYSAELNWKSVNDATDYYLTLYQMSDNASSQTQSFEDFADASKVAIAGWKSNFNRTTRTYKQDGNYSLYFNNSGEYVETETYPANVNQISFWVAPYNVSPSDAVIGKLKLEGYNGKKWVSVVNEITILAKTEKGFLTFDVDESLGLSQFRLTATTVNGKGFVIDAFTANMAKQITYVFPNKNVRVESTTLKSGQIETYHVGNLNPNAKYYFYVAASDEARAYCRTHLTDASATIEFSTLEGNTGDRDLTYGVMEVEVEEGGMYYNKQQRMIYVPVADGTSTLYFYDAFGHLVASVPVPAQQNAVPFPAGNFEEGHWYVIKYSPNDKMKRKDRRIKILY